ncbi:MAG: radical SAM family heme chaperone HemW [candidate division NC10 bacterium]|nr:radical SAM family heme chaperone HemW [candidate division NC10 bacterium]
MRPLALYLHIPYCLSRCHYCDFNTYVLDGPQSREYVRALAAEIRHQGAALDAEQRRVETIFFGGGTPSLLPAEDLCALLEACRGAFRVAPEAEITLEANPETVMPEAFVALRRGGFNRVSLGVQALHAGLLQVLGRPHTPARATEAFGAVRAAGFANVNLDVMFGLPGQALRDWRRTLEGVVSLAPEHLSTYGLTIEEGTLFGRLHRRGALRLPAEDAHLTMYREALRYLPAAGYRRYEISSFARPGFACRHNLTYWRQGEYLGLGAGAHGYLGGVRSMNQRLPAAYISAVTRRGSAVVERENPSPVAQVEEALMLGLRLADGLHLAAVAARFGLPDPPIDPAVLARLTGMGLIEAGDGLLRLTEAGLAVSDTVITELAASLVLQPGICA